jgi:hypothetical protein
VLVVLLVVLPVPLVVVLLELVVLPPSGGSTQGPHVPWVLPVGTTHMEPGQQSALMVHAPHLGTQAACEQMKGGVPPSIGLGTQGTPLQQLALDAHAWPGIAHWVGPQRGTPTLSRWQLSWFWQLPLQQSHEALQDMVWSRQMSPSGLQPMGLRHTPTGAPGAMSQVTGEPDPPGRPADPQQSPSAVHRSPTTWQPLAGWQISVPVGP